MGTGGRPGPVDGVTFPIYRGEKTPRFVGESACGKSVTASSAMRLISAPGRIVEGQILFDGKDLPTPPRARECGKIRHADISMIFQGADDLVNPVFTMGYQIAEGRHAAPETVRPTAPRRTHHQGCRQRSASPVGLARVEKYPAPDVRAHAASAS